MELLLSAITIISFLLAVWSVYDSQRRKDKEQARLTILTDRIRSAVNSLEASFATVNAIVQVPKMRSVSTEELQELARVARTQLLVSARGLQDSESLVRSWRSRKTLANLVGKDGSGIASSDDPTAQKESTTDVR
jgi:hypothetical protein